MNQITIARKGKISKEMELVANSENMSVEEIREGVSKGHIVIISGTRNQKKNPVGIGTGLRTKINANIGTSSNFCDPDLELEKAKLAMKYGADTLMDLSTFGPIRKLRENILNELDIPIGTVPIYETAHSIALKTGNYINMNVEDILNTIELQAKQGCGSITVHCGIKKDCLKHVSTRKMGITSRGGAIIARWMYENGKENPLNENFDDLLSIAAKYDIVLSLGAALRSGCLADSGDELHLREILVFSELVEKAKKRDVQVKVEGPGHMPLDMIPWFIKQAKHLTGGVPFGVLGPMVIDIGAGYDHITHAIGFAVAAMAGADFSSAVYPTEHLGLPSLEDIAPGIIAARIAAHAADIVKLGEKSRVWDDEMSEARAALKWNEIFDLSIDPTTASKIYNRVSLNPNACTVCGDFCPFLNSPSFED